MPKGSLRRFDLVALTLVGACVAGLYGAALPDLALRMASSQVEGTVGGRVSGAVPAAPTARLVISHPRAASTTVAALPAGLDAAAVHRVYDSLGYGLDAVRGDAAAVPRVYLTSVPGDIKSVTDVDARKNLFLRTMLPLILKVNEEIAADRARLKAMMAATAEGKALSAGDRRWLDTRSREYGLKTPDMRKLLPRLDVIPPSLALAQAAEESGWGTSRFARQGNALFGQWTTQGDNGIIPLNREDGKTHVIKSFPNLLTAVRAYAHNLNSHRAYAEFRTLRASLRAANKPLDGAALARALHRYSERGEEYVATLHTIMRVNDLPPFDNAALQHPLEEIELASLITQETLLR
ncbi:glucosaminidase domain-containing protein [Novispirillum sp. DQ9]|uniref:glucosaminidase domain-containing protein n=1 Tax=Novispirillum sp. DQ9 TaxID=3398612 RepID=UPI003C7D7748